MGGAAARNTGIKASKGDYVAFLDDDDEWHPSKVAKQLRVFDENPDVGMVYTGCYYVSHRTGAFIKTRHPSEKGRIYNDLLKSNCVGTTSTVIIKRECFAKVGLFDENLREEFKFFLFKLCALVFGTILSFSMLQGSKNTNGRLEKIHYELSSDV